MDNCYELFQTQIPVPRKELKVLSLSPSNSYSEYLQAFWTQII